MNRTYDLKKTLTLTIQAANQSPPVEIVVLNYNSKDDLDDYMDYMLDDLHDGDCYSLVYKKYIGRDYYHMAHAQNLAMLAGSGEYLVNTAADVIPAMDFFSVIRELLSGGDVVWMDSSQHGWPVIGKEEFMATGGFDERLEYYGKNDKDIISRLHRRGGKHVPYPNSIITIIQTPKKDKFRNYKLKSAHRMKILNRDIYEENLRDEVLTVNLDGWGKWDV